MTQRAYNNFSWLLLGIVLLLGAFGWLDFSSWQIDRVFGLAVFSLLGLWAWLIMWTHYILGAIRVSQPGLHKAKYYTPVTEFFVLACILLHPTLLALQLNRSGGGLPPTSFYKYVNLANLKLAVVMGAFSLTLFLSYELLKRFKSRKIVQRNWLIVSSAQVLAMVLIFVHSMRLGNNLQSGWFQVLWVLCFIAFIPAAYIVLKNDANDWLAARDERST